MGASTRDRSQSPRARILTLRSGEAELRVAHKQSSLPHNKRNPDRSFEPQSGNTLIAQLILGAAPAIFKLEDLLISIKCVYFAVAIRQKPTV